MHQHARRATTEQDTPAERERALHGVLDHYVHAAAGADATMPFLAVSRAPAVGQRPAELPPFTDKYTAMAWFGTEYTNLLAAFEAADAAGADRHLCELPRFMRAYFARRCGTTMLNTLFERSLAAPHRLDDPLHLAEAHSDLGFARHNAGRTAEADAAYQAAEPLVTRAGDTVTEAELAMRRGYLRWDQGHLEEPLELFRLAAKSYADADCPTGTAHAIAYETWAMLQLGHREEAARLARTALDVPHADNPAWAPALTARITLGVALAHEDPEQAERHLHEALALAREDGHRHNEAWCLNCLGVALRQMGRHDKALDAHRTAFSLLDELFEEHWKIHFLDAFAETCRLAGLPAKPCACTGGHWNSPRNSATGTSKPWPTKASRRSSTPRTRRRQRSTGRRARRCCRNRGTGEAATVLAMHSPGVRLRAHRLGLNVGRMPTGPHNALTDVPGIRVGHTTLIDPPRVHSGVTAIVPDGVSPANPLPAGVFVGNGYGKLLGSTQVAELGTLETPVLLTSTLSAFRAADALVGWLLERPEAAHVRSLNPVVGECNDGLLSDIRARPVREEHVRSALAEASAGPVAEGCVGGGTGLTALGFKAGIGTSSRRLRLAGTRTTLGVLVQANFGGTLRVSGRTVTPVDLGLPFPDRIPADGSCMIVVATDAALDARQLTRLARRAVYALASTGAGFTHGSGDYALAFGTRPLDTPAGPSVLPDHTLDPLFAAVLAAVEEAVLNSLLAATTTTGPEGRTSHALPTERLSAFLGVGAP